jgi:hypothetical protein
LSLGVERLTELHDVQTTLTQRGTDGRRRVCLASRDLQLHEADNFLGHVFSLNHAGCRMADTLDVVEC